ncbi:MAG: hypothetical protein GXP21_06180 [Gammaproteobacteria bacterium]|nr:hypothetical protein [Gammaproteobacteria bacterium]
MAAVITRRMVITVGQIILRTDMALMLLRGASMAIKCPYRTIPEGTDNQPTKNQRAQHRP